MRKQGQSSNGKPVVELNDLLNKNEIIKQTFYSFDRYEVVEDTLIKQKNGSYARKIMKLQDEMDEKWVHVHLHGKNEILSVYIFVKRVCGDDRTAYDKAYIIIPGVYADWVGFNGLVGKGQGFINKLANEITKAVKIKNETIKINKEKQEREDKEKYDRQFTEILERKNREYKILQDKYNQQQEKHIKDMMQYENELHEQATKIGSLQKYNAELQASVDAQKAKADSRQKTFDALDGIAELMGWSEEYEQMKQVVAAMGFEF